MMRAFDVIASTPLPTRILNGTRGGNLNCFPRVSVRPRAGEQAQSKAPLFIGFHTPDRNYPQYAQQMKASVESHGFECIVEERPSYLSVGLPEPGTWVLNTSIKPFFIRDMRVRYPDRDLIYLDADAVMQHPPSLLLREQGFDFAAPFYEGRMKCWDICSCVLFFRATPAADTLLDIWCQEQKKRIDGMLKGHLAHRWRWCWDEKTLTDVLPLVPGLVWTHLPWTYAKVSDRPDARDIAPEVKRESAVFIQQLAHIENRKAMVVHAAG
jgi:hypothetical protein